MQRAASAAAALRARGAAQWRAAPRSAAPRARRGRGRRWRHWQKQKQEGKNRFLSDSNRQPLVPKTNALSNYAKEPKSQPCVGGKFINAARFLGFRFDFEVFLLCPRPDRRVADRKWFKATSVIL
jgi:hypothetical protein